MDEKKGYCLDRVRWRMWTDGKMDLMNSVRNPDAVYGDEKVGDGNFHERKGEYCR